MAFRSLKLRLFPRKALEYVRPEGVKEIRHIFDMWSKMKQDLMFLSSDKSYACRIRPDERAPEGYKSEVWVKIASHCWWGAAQERELVSAVRSALQSTRISTTFRWKQA